MPGTENLECYWSAFTLTETMIASRRESAATRPVERIRNYSFDRLKPFVPIGTDLVHAGHSTK